MSESNVKSLLGGISGTLVSLTGMSITQINDILGVICSVMGLLISIISCIVIPIVKWRKEAKKDGKIDEKEKEELVDIIQKGSEEAGKRIDEIKESIEGEDKDA